MKQRLTYLLVILILSANSLWSKGLELNEKELASPPPRIIRTCCSFGTDVSVMAIPGFKVTDISSIDQIGPHTYLGNEEEGNGIIYTRKGGFIDLGHLRDQADWTAYLFARILRNQKDGLTIQKLGHEGGVKKLTLYAPTDLDEIDAMQLAGKIAYDLSVWHEIATWFGASSIPLFPERFSSFSIEDAYSNLLGTTLGIEALKSELPFEEAMTLLIDQKLKELDAVTTEAATYEAMDKVQGLWWDAEVALPSKRLLLKRQLKVYPEVSPLLLPEDEKQQDTRFDLTVPSHTQDGESLNYFYQFSLKLNHKFPYKQLFPNRKGRWITQDDFGMLIDEVALRIEKMEEKDEMKKQKVELKKKKVEARQLVRQTRRANR